MKSNLIFIYVFLLLSCGKNNNVQSNKAIKSQVSKVLDKWHEDAANAKFDDYFNAMSNKGVFIGTDATENWTTKAFKAYAKPHFDKGKAWSFKALERNIYVSEDANTVWFDELLDTQMELCRGSGVLQQEKGTWKIQHYVLSLTIPNEKITETIRLKKEIDSIFVKKLGNSL